MRSSSGSLHCGSRDFQLIPMRPRRWIRYSGTLSGGPAGIYRDFGNGSSYSFVGGKFEGKKLSAVALARELDRYADRPIVDMTELKDAYDVRFEVIPEDYQVLLRRAAVNSGMVIPAQIMRAIDNDSNPLPQAIEQVGLKLEPRRMSVDLLVIDQVRRTPHRKLRERCSNSLPRSSPASWAWPAGFMVTRSAMRFWR